MEKFNADVFEKFDKEWALLTAGNEDSFNTMTISWGSMGTLWNKPVVTAYVRESRYTKEFMDKNEYFTVSFYPGEFKKDLGILGSKSGRDGDKVSLTSLTPKSVKESMTFEQAKQTLLCKKLFVQKLDTKNMPEDVQKNFYANGDDHYMYIGEVVDIC